MKKKLSLSLIPLFLSLICHFSGGRSHPSPAPWPEQFHALLYMTLNKTRFQMTDLWYDWPAGLNVNIIQKQLVDKLYDVEWNNGTSFYFTLEGGDQKPSCQVRKFGVGIPRPDFLLDGAEFVGTLTTDGFRCNVWNKLDFILYYEDVVSKRPVRWDFLDDNEIITHVMTFEVGATLPDISVVQAPSYCFNHDMIINQ